MSSELDGTVASTDLDRFSRVIETGALPDSQCVRRLDIDPEQVKNGLAQLVLTLIKLLHELLERQALRRMDVGDLSETEIDRLGTTLMRQSDQIDELREAFGLSEDDLNLDLGPLGRLL
jgi:Gas vesicle protein K